MEKRHAKNDAEICCRKKCDLNQTWHCMFALQLQQRGVCMCQLSNADTISAYSTFIADAGHATKTTQTQHQTKLGPAPNMKHIHTTHRNAPSLYTSWDGSCLKPTVIVEIQNVCVPRVMYVESMRNI